MKEGNEVEKLTDLHRKLMHNLINQRFDEVVSEFERLEPTEDIAAIKISLVITAAFKENAILLEPRKKLLDRYNTLFDQFSLPPNP